MLPLILCFFVQALHQALPEVGVSHRSVRDSKNYNRNLSSSFPVNLRRLALPPYILDLTIITGHVVCIQLNACRIISGSRLYINLRNCILILYLVLETNP